MSKHEQELNSIVPNSLRSVKNMGRLIAQQIFKALDIFSGRSSLAIESHMDVQ